MLTRERNLVKFSSTCIFYLMESVGGTVYTVDYAQKKGLNVINLAL